MMRSQATHLPSTLVHLEPAAFTEMSDDGARSMRDMSALRHVNLDSCPVGDGAARALSNLPDLESVTLADTDVGPRARRWRPRGATSS